MKAVVADHRYRIHCVRVETRGGLVVRLTDHPRDVVMSNDAVYRTDSGYQFTGNQASVGFAAGAMDLEGVADVAGVNRDAVASGVFDGARMYVFATSWRAPVEDEEPIGAAILGKTTLLDERYRIEMMALVDALNQSVGRTYAPGCYKTFGGQEFAGCKVDLPALTVVGTLSGVTNAAVVSDSVRTEAADYFAAGTIRYITGANAGLKPLEIKAFAGGVVETFEPAYYLPEVGDEYEMIPGCRKRLEDCRDKWGNVLNFGGFSYVPTSTQYMQVGAK